MDVKAQNPKTEFLSRGITILPLSAASKMTDSSSDDPKTVMLDVLRSDTRVRHPAHMQDTRMEVSAQKDW